MTETVHIARPHVVVAAIGYEQGSSICAATGEALRALIADIDPVLTGSIGPEAFSSTGGVLAAWLSARSDHKARQDRWNAVRDRFTPFLLRRADDIRLPQCVLILPAQRLIDEPARRALATDLTCARELFACFLLVFLDENGSLAPLQDVEVASAWLTAFAPMSPARIALYVLSTTAPSGEPISAADMVRLCGVALAADLVLPHDKAERVLSYRSGAPVITLGTFGGRSLEFDHAALANRLQARLVKDLLSQTVFHEVPSPPSTPTVPATASELLLNATPTQGPHGVKLHIAGRASTGLVGQPAVVGANFQATPSFGGLARQLHLDGVPRREWVEQLHEWDVLLRNGILPPLLEHVSRSLIVAQREQLVRIREFLASTLASTGGAALAQPACDAVVQRTTEQYDVRVARENAPSLGETLERVRGELARIPHLPSLVLRTAMLAAVPGFVLLLAIISGSDSPWRGPLQWTLLLLVLAAPILATIARLRGLAATATARDRAIEEAERRCQLRYAQVAATGLTTLRTSLLQQVADDSKRMAAMVDALRLACEPAAQAGSHAVGRLVRLLPEARDDDRFYEMLFGKDSARGNMDLLSPQFMDRIQREATRVLDGAGPPPSVVEALHTFARNELSRDLRARFRLWHLLRPDAEAEVAVRDPDVARELLSGLIRGEAVACWHGRAVEHALLDPHASMRAYIAPRVLLPMTPDESLVRIDSEMLDVVAVFCRVELATREHDIVPTSLNAAPVDAKDGPE